MRRSVTRRRPACCSCRATGSWGALHRELDILVSTSWHEGTPLAVLEAMATGVPVVASDVGGPPELVRPGETGALFPAGDEGAAAAHVLALLPDDDLRRRAGSATRPRGRARESAGRPTWRLTGLWTELAGAARAGEGRAA